MIRTRYARPRPKSKNIFLAPRMLIEMKASATNVKALAVFSLIKATFKNSVVYNYNPLALCKKLNKPNLSRYTIATSVSLLIKLGYASKKGNHLVLSNSWGITDSCSKHYSWRKVCTKDESFDSIIESIQVMLLKYNFDRQSHRLKANIKNGVVNDFRCSLQSERPTNDVIPDNVIGSRSFGKFIGVSHVTANRLIGRLHKQHKINCKAVIWINNNKSQNEKPPVGYSYVNSKGKLVTHFGRQISF